MVEGQDGREEVDQGRTAPLYLLHLCDSLFPIGGFGYSDGLEAATSSGRVATAADLGAWLDAIVDDTLGRVEAPAVWQAWDAFAAADLAVLNPLEEELAALRPSSSMRRSSRAMGLRLLTTWQTLHPDGRLAQVVTLAASRQQGVALPIAFAGACACTAIAQRRAVEAFAYTRLAATVSAAMRLMPIGQTGAHGLLARALQLVPAAIDAMIARNGQLQSFTPQMDIAAMSQQHLHSRLFRS